jgi:hypothetical protein
MDPYDNPFWDLTTVAAWAVIREPAAVRAASDPDNEYALLDIRGAFPGRVREVNELLWLNSGWLKPNDPRDLKVARLADDVDPADLPPPLDKRRAERMVELEAEGKIRLWQDDTFPITDYLRFLFQTGRLTAVRNGQGEGGAQAIPAADWAFLDVAGGEDQRLFIRRIGERGPAFRDVRVERAEVLAVFPPPEAAPIPMRPQPGPAGHGKKAAAMAWLQHSYPEERPPGLKNPDLQRLFERDGGVAMHPNTFGQAVRDAWRN